MNLLSELSQPTRPKPLPIAAHSFVSFQGVEYHYPHLQRLTELFEERILPYLDFHPRIAWVGKNHPAAIALYFACLRNNLWFICSRSSDSYSLGRLRQDQNVLQFSDSGVSLQFFQYSKSAVPLKPEGGGLILPSSGTTDIAKFCRIPFSVSTQNAQSAADLLDLKNKEASVVWSSFGSTAGWNTLLLPSLMAGTPVKLYEEFSAFSALDALSKLKNSVFHFSPLQAQLLTSISGWKSLNKLNNNLCVIGSTDVHPRTIRNFCEKNLTVLRNYGLTEAGPYVISKLTRPDEVSTDDLSELGTLTSTFESRLRPVPDNPDSYHLDLRGPAVFGGYLGGIHLSEYDWFETGDVISKRNDKYYFLSRASDAFQLQGKTIFPNEVENFIVENCPTVRECLVSKIKGELHLTVGPENVDLNSVSIATQKYFKNSTFPIKTTVVRRLQRNSAGKSLRNH